MTRLGLVGAGRWGRIYIRTLAAAPDARLAALASGNPDSAMLVPADCALFGHWRDLIAAAGVDGLIIATPPASHAEIAIAALDAGLPVLVEKPVTLNGAEARAIHAAAVAAGRPVLVDHIHLFSPAWRALKALVAAGAIGKVTAINSIAGNHGPYRRDASVLWDWAPHDLSMILDLMGMAPSAIEAQCLERREVAGGFGETVALAMDMAGIPASVVIGTLMDKTRRFTVHGESGTLVYDDLAAAKLVRYPQSPLEQPTPQDGEAVTIASDAPLSVAVRDFATAIQSGKNDLASLELGIAVVDVLERCDTMLV